jgi:hypothetical protein
VTEAPRLDLIDLIDNAVDRQLRAHALELAIGGAHLDRREKDALMTLATSHLNRRCPDRC